MNLNFCQNVEATPRRPGGSGDGGAAATELIRRLAESRRRLLPGGSGAATVRKESEEGGCGVVGFCCSEPVPGRHIYEPSRQMHNRGNGKGGGIAAVGLVPEQLGVSRDVLDTHYLLHIAFIDPALRAEIEAEFIKPFFEVAASARLDQVSDWKSVPGLEVLPPEVSRYFVRVKPRVLDEFIGKNRLDALDRAEAEAEFVSQNSFNLNQKYYASLGEKRAFVLSHGRDIMILKVVGYAEAIVKYYKIEELCAHEWIAHQRFPTKGRVWHPGGAHPFAAIDMALERLEPVDVPKEATSNRKLPQPVATSESDFVSRVTAAIVAGRGDLLPVSALPVDGTFPTGTAKIEKRSIAAEIPIWDPSICIDCG